MDWGDILKLAFLAPEFLPTWGGVGIYSVELIKNLCQNKDIEIHVITPKRGPNYNPSKILKFFNNKITLHNISKANDDFFYNLNFQLSVLKNFQKLNKRYKFDIVHSANLVHMPDIYLKFKKLKIPSVTTVHTTLKSQSHVNGQIKLKKSYCKKTIVEKLTCLYYPFIKFLERIYLRRTTNLITVSNWIKGFVNENNNSQNIRVIHNGVDVNRFSPENNISNENKFKFLDDVNKPIILYCGRLLALKGLKTLIDSMKEILKKEDAYFVFAGSGNIKMWDKLLKLNNIPKKNYRFLGYVEYEKIHHLYSKADIFVLPSFTESCPLTVLEAMSNGLPVIATKVGGTAEIIRNNEDGILIEAANVNALTKNILKLLNNSTLRKRISNNARRKVKKRFNTKVMAMKTKKFYEDILSKKGC